MLYLMAEYTCINMNINVNVKVVWDAVMRMIVNDE
jgi:hypothetical protein